MEKLGSLSHLFVTVFLHTFAGVMAIPAITDVTMAAVCPGRDECSLAIFLSGFQQAVTGLGALVMMPIIGNLSDKYGRKALLTLPMALDIIPLVILAYSRETKFFYAYYVLRTLTAMIGEAGVGCLAIAYLADNISESKRASAFGVLSGIMSGSFVCGTLSARFLSPALTFQVAAVASMLSTAYMRIFLKDMACNNGTLEQPFLKTGQDDSQPENTSASVKAIKNIPSPGDLLSLLKSSTTFSQAASVAFFSGLSEGGFLATITYYLKARFHFNKDQFADIMLIAGVTATISQLLLMPLLVPAMGEAKLLSLGLLMGCINMTLDSIAWRPWVPYAVSGFSAFAVFTVPCIRSIASKQVGPTEQGKAQGCISGISSFANIISPLIFSPLTAVFLSERAPFDFPGFSIMCIGLGSMIAFIQSIMIKVADSSHKVDSNFAEA